MDEFLVYVQEIDPLWSVALVAAALGVMLIAKLWRSSFAYALVGLLTFTIVGAVAAGGFYGYSYLEDQRRIEERRALDERVEALFSKTIEPDSVFACIDGSPAPAMLEACERNLFAEPQRVAAAVAIVTQRLTFLGDALAFARERDRSYAERIAPMRNAIESDPYGFVAFVLSVEHGCTHEKCGRFGLMRNATRVRENMRSRRLEAYMAKHSAAWRSDDTPSAPAAASARGSAPLITISGDPVAKSAPAAEKSGSSEATATPSQASTPLVETEKAASPPVPAEIPAAALAPILPPPSGTTFSEEKREPTSAAAPAAAKSMAKGNDAAKSAGSEASKGSGGAAKSAPSAAQSAATQQKSKAKVADPVTRRSSEPVAGLPRVVPSDYKREQEEKEDAAAQSAVRPQPGAPTPITPPVQNFTGN